LVLFDVPCVVISLSQLLFVYPPFPVRSICAAGPLLPNVQWTPDESGARSHRPVIADVFRPVGGCFLSTYRALCFVSSLLFVYPPFPASWICSCHRVIRRPLGTQLCGVTPLSSPTCLAGSAMVFFNVPCVAFPLSPLLFVYPPFPVGSISAAGPLPRNAHFTPDNSGVRSRLPVLADIFRRLGGCFFLRYRALSSVSPCYSLLIPPSLLLRSVVLTESSVVSSELGFAERLQFVPRPVRPDPPPHFGGVPVVHQRDLLQSRSLLFCSPLSVIPPLPFLESALLFACLASYVSLNLPHPHSNQSVEVAPAPAPALATAKRRVGAKSKKVVNDTQHAPAEDPPVGGTARCGKTKATAVETGDESTGTGTLRIARGGRRTPNETSTGAAGATSNRIVAVATTGKGRLIVGAGASLGKNAVRALTPVPLLIPVFYIYHCNGTYNNPRPYVTMSP